MRERGRRKETIGTTRPARMVAKLRKSQNVSKRQYASVAEQMPQRHSDDAAETVVAAQLAAIVESSDDAIISKDLNGVITTWNQAAERVFGYTASEVIGRPVTMLMPPERYDEEPGILARVRRGERIDHYETVRRRKDGTLLDISLTVSPIIDHHGKVIGASKIARDITQRKQAAALAAFDYEAMSRLHDVGLLCVRSGPYFAENLSKILGAAMWISGADKGTLQLFDEAPDTLKLMAHRGFDTPFLEFMTTLQRDQAFASGAALKAGARVVVEDVANDGIFAGQPSLAIFLDAGVRALQSTPLVSSTWTVLGMVTTYFTRVHRPSDREGRLLEVLARQAADYVERKRGEEQREQLLRRAQHAREDAEAANRAKDEFLAMLGHELRNPLTAVRNSIAAATLDEKSQRRALKIARRQTELLCRIVDDLLDVARITRGRVPLRKERISISDVLQRTVDGARGAMDEYGHSLTVSLPTDAIYLEADAARLEQAVANLLTNAAKYTEPGGMVSVSAMRDGGDVVIRVCDNGMGISPEILPRVFDLFTQGDRSLDRPGGGLGIGLTLVRRIVELHGGTVEAKSPGIGEGAVFIIRLPALPSGVDEAPANLRELERKPAAQHPARVLVVEDNADSAESLEMLLAVLGHEVRIVQDGMAALEAARANMPDIMLIDIGLPGMDGYEIARSIRGEVSLRHLVLVALTGYGRPEDKAEAMAAGFDYHLVKPVDLNELTEVFTRFDT